MIFNYKWIFVITIWLLILPTAAINCIELLYPITPSMGFSGSKRVKMGANTSVKIPSDFVEMNDDMIASKYPASHRPVSMFTDPNGQIDVGLTQTKVPWNENDLYIMSKFYKASILNLYDSVEFFEDTIKFIKKRPYIFFKFKTKRETRTITDKKVTIEIFVVQRYAISNNQLYLFSFYCPGFFKKEWEKKAEKMLKTILID